MERQLRGWILRSSPQPQVCPRPAILNCKLSTNTSSSHNAQRSWLNQLVYSKTLQGSFESLLRPPLQGCLGTLVWSAFGAHPSAICCILTCPNQPLQERKWTLVRFNRTKWGRLKSTLRNWLLLYFSVKTKSSVRYHFLNICAQSYAQPCDSCYNVLRLCNAVWSRYFGAECVVECSGTDISHAFLFSNHNRISPTNRLVCNAYRTESLVPNGSIRIPVSLHP